MFGIGAQEMIVILVVALLVFGPKRLPELARTVGRGLAEFRRASTDMRQAFNLEEAEHKIERPPQPAQAGIERPSSPEADTAGAESDATKSGGEAPDIPPLTDFERHTDGKEPIASVPTDPRASTTPPDKKPPEPSGGG